MSFRAVIHWPEDRVNFGETVPCSRCKGKGQKFIKRAGKYKTCYLCQGLGYYIPNLKMGRA